MVTLYTVIVLESAVLMSGFTGLHSLVRVINSISLKECSWNTSAILALRRISWRMKSSLKTGVL